MPDQKLYIRRLSSLAFMLAILLSSSCGFEQESGRDSVTLAAFELYHSALIVAADQSEQYSSVNCFKKASLDVIIIPRSKGPDIVDAVVGGSADFGTLANTPLVFQALQGQRLKIFATIMASSSDIKLVGLRDRGISEPGDIAGKKVGYVGGTFGEIFLDRLLEKYAINRADIALVSAGPSQLRDLFLAGDLDALVIWEPIVQDIVNNPAMNSSNLFVEIDRTLYTGRIHLVALPETLEKKREDAERLLQSLICGEGVLSNSPTESRRRLEAWLGREPDTLEAIFNPKSFHVELEPATLSAELAEEARWANEAVFNGSRRVPDSFDDWIDTSVLRSVDESRVQGLQQD